LFKFEVEVEVEVELRIEPATLSAKPANGSFSGFGA
jgi:hypothetical protein